MEGLHGEERKIEWRLNRISYTQCFQTFHLSHFLISYLYFLFCFIFHSFISLLFLSPSQHLQTFLLSPSILLPYYHYKYLKIILTIYQSNQLYYLTPQHLHTTSHSPLIPFPKHFFTPITYPFFKHPSLISYTPSTGLIITFVGMGEHGFKSPELRLIGPSLIGCGFLFCLLRLFFCSTPACCAICCGLVNIAV